jgi:hypothetical protein
MRSHVLLFVFGSVAVLGACSTQPQEAAAPPATDVGLPS